MSTATIKPDNQNLRKFEKVCQILERYNYDKEKLIPILQAVQEEYRYLPERVLNFTATSLDLPPAKVFGVATFFSHFTLTPKGKYVIKLCDGTACHVRDSIDILDAIKAKLGLGEEENTTSDMLFTVETVSCLGACGLAPVLVINEDVYGQMDGEKSVELIEQIIAEEKK